MNGIGDIFKLLANNKFSNMMEDLASNLGKEYAEKVKRGEANSENLMKAGSQIAANIDKHMPDGIKDIVKKNEKKVLKLLLRG